MNSLTPPPPAARRENEEHQERTPPPPATPLDFPRCQPRGLLGKEHQETYDLVKIFSNILRTGPNLGHLEALNVNVDQDVPLESLLPENFMPPSSWLEEPHQHEDSITLETVDRDNETLSNQTDVPGHALFHARVKELLNTNDNAFSAARRERPAPNQTHPRLVHFRKFWDGLSYVAEYWDTSLDRLSKLEHYDGAIAMDIDELRSRAREAIEKSSGEDIEAQKEETYTGRRHDTGRNMPGIYRQDTVSAFVETIALNFRCRLERSRIQPKLRMQGTIFPLPHAETVYRFPADHRQARRGVLEGPVAAVYCRDQTSFRRAEDAEGEGKQEVLDLLHEVGLMLMIAQKRAREDEEEEVPGQGEWWATKPRWGGGPGGEIGTTEDDNANDPSSSEAPRKRSKKTSKAELWRTVRPPASTWEKGIKYLHVGKEKGTEMDDIYLISSLNHHISIVHLRVNSKYVDYLSARPDRKKISAASQQPWYKLEIKRSRWFDFLVPEDRAQAMRGIWAVFWWLTRSVKDGVEDGPLR